MCDELKKELEENHNLGRRARRIKERELKKKYKNKNIRIKSGKSFKKTEGLNKTQRRQLLKDKNLLNELRKIIRKYFPSLNNLYLL